MKVAYSPADLIAFEDRIAVLFADKHIHAPVHLAGGNEAQLIRVFEEHVNEQDWVLCSWRSHYHVLLKGVPPEEVERAIIEGRSISLCFPEHRVLSSGIAGGIAPIAVGLAMGIKRKLEDQYWDPDKNRKVVCFLGDMAAEMGIVHESIKYAVGHYLPVLFVVEDNGLSVSTETAAVWGNAFPLSEFGDPELEWTGKHILRYRYKLTRPHVGIGKHIAF